MVFSDEIPERRRVSKFARQQAQQHDWVLGTINQASRFGDSGTISWP
jgi:hypothetical protein